MKANLLLKENIESALRHRGEKAKDLAQWCHRTESWISKILNNPSRGLPLKYLDRIADFFGVETYELFLPGASSLTERRRGERRIGKDRRISYSQRQMLEYAAQVQRLHPRMSMASLTDTAAQAELDAIHKAEGGIREESKSRRKSKQKR